MSGKFAQQRMEARMHEARREFDRRAIVALRIAEHQLRQYNSAHGPMGASDAVLESLWELLEEAKAIGYV